MALRVQKGRREEITHPINHPTRSNRVGIFNKKDRGTKLKKLMGI